MADELFFPAELKSLEAWLADNVPELGDGGLQTQFITGGSSNIVVRLSRGTKMSVVLRKAPAMAPPASGAAIQREATVLKGLAGSSVPHPKFFGYCEDAKIAGGPFYVMDMVDGWAATITPEDTTIFAPKFSSGPDQYYIAYAMVDGMIEMANFDYISAGLEGYGKPDAFLERQVQRWRGQLKSYPERYPGFMGRDLPGMEYVSDWLNDNRPSTGRPGLMHGDYAVNNVLFANDPPARLVAIIDWETSTIGDPLMDLAGYCIHLRSAKGNPAAPQFDNTNFPTKEEVVAYYADMTKRDVSAIDYYMILYRYRMACICEYKVAESAVGRSPKQKGERFDRIVRRLFLEAEQHAKIVS